MLASDDDEREVGCGCNSASPRGCCVLADRQAFPRLARLSLSPLTDAFSLRRGRRRQRDCNAEVPPPGAPAGVPGPLRGQPPPGAARRGCRSANSSPACTPTTARHPREALGPEAAPARDAPEGGLQGASPAPGADGARARRVARSATRGQSPSTRRRARGGHGALLRDLLTRAAPAAGGAAARGLGPRPVPSKGRAARPPRAACPEEQLPYMGEMLLDARPAAGRSPRRRHPHLISKNYGLHGAGLGVAGAMHEQPMEQESLARLPQLQPAAVRAGRRRGAGPERAAQPVRRDRPFKREPEGGAPQGDLPRIKLEPPSVIEEEEASRGGEVASPAAWRGRRAGGWGVCPRTGCTTTPSRTEDGPQLGQSTPWSRARSRRNLPVGLKRSALFIPPSDPSTEVSICKFKFTGGPNPILEEKKMLSGKLLDNISKCETDVKKIRLESDTEDTCSLSGRGSATTSPVATLERGMQPPMLAPPMEDSPKRKRRSKKSSVREKAGQTLARSAAAHPDAAGEVGRGRHLLQVPSAARKFTANLSSSWKDYLPGQEAGGGIPLDGYSDPALPPSLPPPPGRGPTRPALTPARP
ncbi:hypothetical protein C7M84_014241 [Penaeus vannamei]|uniref:Uncharacterized protein n=1 Tax=Penaeus vannamei TaxID=6689 RepID=A0A423STX8_PENVA|nr:hypothetical protein C7M84_014241 [Penaeus vannamei]